MVDLPPTLTPPSGPSIPISTIEAPPINYLFSDEFNGSALNSVWTNGKFWWGDGLTGERWGELENYMHTQATVSEGYLKLVAINQPSDGRPYTSGLVTTGGILGKRPVGFSFLYGYVEARIKLPSGDGVWPAFWLWPADYMDPPEIDILENIGKEPNRYYGTLHNPVNDKDVQAVFNSNVKLSDDFHIYAVDWQPDYIDFYIDNLKISHFVDVNHYFSKPMYLLMNVAVGGSWPGPVDETILPAVMLVDWVHVYQINPIHR